MNLFTHPFPPIVRKTPLGLNFNLSFACAFVTLASLASAQAAAPSSTPKPAGDSANVMPEVVVTAPSGASPTVFDEQTPPVKARYDLPQTTESVTANQIQQTVNLVDTEDALKYLPSLFLRKRNNGDTQATLETRTWGVNSSARSLVYADDLLLSALIGNNNTNGAPRWGLVPPESIQRIDVLYGPFSAAYPGNSMGGVVQITTRMPDKLTAILEQTETFQPFDRYDTKDTYRTDQTNFVFGDKVGRFAWMLSGDFQNSASQPLFFITNGSIPKSTAGTIPALNKVGAVADVVGSGGLLHTQMSNVNAKMAWDLTPWLTATYQVGVWTNHTDSHVQTYLTDPSGSSTFAGISGFANDYYTLNETHLSNALSLKTDTKGAFDADFSFSDYYYVEDIQRNPFGVLSSGTDFTDIGKITRMDGTNWLNTDLKGIWRPSGDLEGPHEVSFGLHLDRYFLNNPVYQTPTWDGGPSTTSSLYTNSRGSTITEGLWLQDAWRFNRFLKLTVGGRLEYWRASEGYNLATTTSSAGLITGTTVNRQPDLNALRFSPKASLSWTPAPEWEITGSFGQAYRFPTVTELYQIVASGPAFATPNPHLAPEKVLSEELAIERKFPDGHIRLSVFNENTHDALISQTNFINQVPLTFVTNVQSIRNTGVELAGQKDNLFVRGLSVFGSVTYVDSETLKDPTFASTTGTTAVGKRVPYVPDWRATAGVTIHPIQKLSLTAALRYSGKQYSTLDNTDSVSHVFGAFDRFMVVDIRAQYQINDRITLDLGIDNLTNEQYTLYHPFPDRTYTASLKFQF